MSAPEIDAEVAAERLVETFKSGDLAPMLSLEDKRIDWFAVAVSLAIELSGASVDEMRSTADLMRIVGSWRAA